MVLLSTAHRNSRRLHKHLLYLQACLRIFDEHQLLFLFSDIKYHCMYINKYCRILLNNDIMKKKNSTKMATQLCPSLCPAVKLALSHSLHCDFSLLMYNQAE